MGMPHRGRLNVLANVATKPVEAIMHEFRGSADGTFADMEPSCHLPATFPPPACQPL